MDKVTILNNYIDFKKISVHSKDKIKDIERYIVKFINFNEKPLEEFNESDIVKFLNGLGYAIGSMNGVKALIKNFVKWYYLDWSSRFRNLDSICKQQKPPRTYEPEQMLNLVEVETLINEEKDLMFKVYWLVLFYGGFRPSEACNLSWNDILFEPKGTSIKLHTGKTNKDFYKSLPDKVDQYLKQWKGVNTSKWLFPSSSSLNQGETIKARSVCARLKRHSIKVLNKEVVPYQLRHSIATILYGDNSKDADDVADQMGHTKSMKATYMHLDADKIKERARRLWVKPKALKPEEQDELKQLRISVKQLKEYINLDRLQKIEIIDRDLKMKSWSNSERERLKTTRENLSKIRL